MTSLNRKTTKPIFANPLALAVCTLSVAAGLPPTPSYAQGAIEEITVTARKRAESLQDVPIAVSAFTGNALKNKGVVNVAQVADYTPGLEMDATAAISGSSAALTTFIRGIGMSDFLLTIDPGVGLYVDDVYVARSVGGLVDLLDIERIEILKGPQGTLFGRNTIGGAVAIHSKDPGEELAGSLGITLGTDNRLDVRGKIEIPLLENLLSSFSFSSKTQDGYGKRLPFPADYTPLSIPAGSAPDAFGNGELYGNGDDLGEVNTQAVRAKFLYTGEDFQARLSLDASKARETAPVSTLLGFTPTYGTGAALADAHNAAVLGLLAPGALPPANSLIYDERWITGDKHTTYGNAPSQSDYDLFGASLILNWQIGDLEIKSITAYRDLDSAFGRDGDSSPIILDHTRNEYEHEQFSQEIQFTGSFMDDRLKWVAGLYYFEEEGFDRVQVPLGLEVDLALTGQPGTVINLWLDEANDVENTSKAVFAQATYEITENLSATLGIRHTQDDKKYRPTHVTQGVAPVALLIDSESVDFDDTSPRFSLDYRWNENVFTYLSYSAGFKSGGFTGRTVDPKDGARPFDPEEAETYEIGVKLDFDRIRINAALFSTDYTDLQVINQEGITPITVNAGESEIKGLEIEIQAAPTDNINLMLGYAYLDADYTDISDPNATIDDSFDFANTPKNTFNFSADYFIDLKGGNELLLRLDYSWKDDHFNDAENTPLLAQDSFGLLNLSAALTLQDHWHFSAGIKNVTDEIYLFSGFSQPGVGFIEGSYSRGREYYFTTEYRF